MIFAFGPNNTYFFDDGNGNRKWRAGPELDAYMNSGVVGTIKTLALGTDGAFFLNYTTGNGLQHMNAWEDPQDRYPALHAWLFTEDVPHSRQAVTVTLGTQGSFFAVSDQGHRWRNLPEGLQDYYQKFTRPDLFLKSRVQCVDFGVNGTYLGVGLDNVWFWDLENEYPELTTMLGQKGVNNLQTLVINPFAPRQHVAVFSNKTVHWSLPPLWLQDLQDLFKQYANKAGAHIPSIPTFIPPSFATPPSLPQRPPMHQSSSSTSSGRWRPSWTRPGNSSSSSPGQGLPTMSPPHSPPVQSPTVQTPGGPNFDWNQAMGTTQSVVDAWNNAQGQGQSGAMFNGGYPLNSSGNTFNNAGGGLQLVNDLANNGVMIGQLAGQFAGTAAACCVM